MTLQNTRIGRMTGDVPPALSCFELAARELRVLGITLTRLPGEYRVNFHNGTDATACITETLEDAIEHGRALARASPAKLVRPARKRPLRMTPKVVRRRMIRAHNRCMRARAIRQEREDGLPP